MFGSALRVAMTPATQPDPGYIAVGVRVSADVRRRIDQSELIGISDGKLGTFSCWYRRFATGGFQTFFSVGLFGVDVRFHSDNKIRFKGTDPGSPSMEFNSSPQTDTSLWHHVLASWNRGTGTTMLYVDGADDNNEVSPGSNANINYTNFTAICSDINSASKMNAELVDMWVDYTVALDFTDPAIRLKFRSATGKPVFLGDNGEFPIGSSPKAFFSGDKTDWETNKGTMGQFDDAVNGSFADASSSPS